MAVGAVGPAGAGIEDTEIVLDFGGGGDEGAGGAGGVFLANGNGRGETGNAFDVGVFEPAKELAGIRGEALDEAALTLGKEGVHGEGRFPGTGDAGHNREGVLGDPDVHALEVVLGGAFDFDEAVAGLAVAGAPP